MINGGSWVNRLKRRSWSAVGYLRCESCDEHRAPPKWIHYLHTPNVPGTCIAVAPPKSSSSGTVLYLQYPPEEEVTRALDSVARQAGTITPKPAQPAILVFGIWCFFSPCSKQMKWIHT